MGKIIKDGFQFMEYANSGLIRNTEDIPALKNELIALSERKTHLELSEYALLLAEHILSMSGVERSAEIEACFSIVAKWQDRKAKFQDALEVAGRINSLAREEKDMVKAKALRAMGQVAATPHVRWHALVASEYAIVMTNLMYPQNLDKVKEERELQIALMKNV